MRNKLIKLLNVIGFKCIHLNSYQTYKYISRVKSKKISYIIYIYDFLDTVNIHININGENFEPQSYTLKENIEYLNKEFCTIIRQNKIKKLLDEK